MCINAKISEQAVFFFQNEEIFVQLDELDELDRITMNRIQLQPYTSTENILV